MCSLVGQEENYGRSEIVYATSGLVPVMRYMREPIIDWDVITCSFGCSVIPFVSVIPFCKGMHTVLQFSVPN